MTTGPDMEHDTPSPKGSGPQLEDLPQPILDRITSYAFADNLSCIAETKEEHKSRIKVSRFATVSRKWQLAVERLLWAEVHLSVRRLDQLPRLGEALLSRMGGHRAGLIKTIKYEGEVEYDSGGGMASANGGRRMGLFTSFLRELRSSLSEREQMRGGKRSRELDEGVDEDEARDSKKRLV